MGDGKNGTGKGGANKALTGSEWIGYASVLVAVGWCGWLMVRMAIGMGA